jgi:hypothetical protein
MKQQISLSPFTPSASSLVLALVIGYGMGSNVFLEDVERLVGSVIVPLYSSLVIVYLTGRIYRIVEPSLKSYSYQPPQHLQKQDDEALRLAKSAKQPIDLTGAYKLVENDNFEAFLAVQGVPWALRGAANKLRPTHRIQHEGNVITIKIEGIIESQTTYTIDGPPIQGMIRGRLFEDQVKYIDSGICTTKQACDNGYAVQVTRILSPDKKEIRMGSKVSFDDKSKSSVQCRQLFRRVE